MCLICGIDENNCAKQICSTNKKGIVEPNHTFEGKYLLEHEYFEKRLHNWIYRSVNTRQRMKNIWQKNGQQKKQTVKAQIS